MTGRQQLAAQMGKYDRAVVKVATAALAAMRRRLPGAFELVYDTHALAIGFGPTEKTGDVVFSIVLFPRWVSLFFLRHGAMLPDPDERLRGGGKRARHVVLERGAATLDEPAIRELMAVALERAEWMPAGGRGTIVIKSIAQKRLARPNPRSTVGDRATRARPRRRSIRSR
jgi:hypothetical protein